MDDETNTGLHNGDVMMSDGRPPRAPTPVNDGDPHPFLAAFPPAVQPVLAQRLPERFDNACERLERAIESAGTPRKKKARRKARA